MSFHSYVSLLEGNEYSAAGWIPTSIIFQELKCGFVQKHPNQESNVFVVSHMFITTIGILGVYLIPCCWLQNDRYSTRSQWWYNDGVLVVVPVLVLCRWHKSALSVCAPPFDVGRGRRKSRRKSYGIFNYIPSILLSISSVSSQKRWVTYCYHLLS